MTIPEIKLTSDEMNAAVHSYLQCNGINVPVESVEKNYRGTGWLITLKDPDEPAPAPTPATPAT